MFKEQFIQRLFAKGEANIGEYVLRQSQGKYSLMFTVPEANNCFDPRATVVILKIPLAFKYP